MVRLPTDIASVRTIGVEAWQSDYVWPVNDEAWFAVLDRVWRAFDRAYEGLDQTGRDLILADHNFPGFIAEHIHARMVESHCARTGIECVIGPASNQYYRPDWAALGNAHAKALATPPDLWRMRVRNWGKALMLGDAPLVRRLGALLKRPDTLSLGSFSSLKREYLAARDETCGHTHWPVEIARLSGAPAVTPPDNLQAAVKAITAEAAAAAREAEAGEIDQDAIVAAWLQRLSVLGTVYATAWPNGVPKRLLVCEVGRPFNRVLAMAARRRGCHTVGFHHGNDVTNQWAPISAYIEYALFDEFVVPTEAAARFHEQEHLMAPIARLCPVRFSHTNTGRYAALAARCAAVPPPARIKTVMVMGMPMNASRRPAFHHADFFLFHLDLELRVIDLLKRNGYRVVYKMHPDRKTEAAGIYDSRADQIESRPFEETWQEADAIFYGFVRSSTFPFALCTSRPMVVLDVGGQDWNPETLPSLQRRCTILPAQMDERNRITFDEAALLAALAQPVTPPDTSYISEFMSPV